MTLLFLTPLENDFANAKVKEEEGFSLTVIFLILKAKPRNV